MTDPEATSGPPDTVVVRPEVSDLVEFGSFPASRNVVPEVIAKQEQLLRSITPPISDDEARQLLKLFGPDDYFGGAWTVLHLVESAPNWPLLDSLTDESNEWIARLKGRARRKHATRADDAD